MSSAIQASLEALRLALAAETGIQIDEERWSNMDFANKCAWIIAVLRALIGGEGSADTFQ
ncbi:hypothetical protein SLNSH_01715 [Alsobacter soli]|uniref:Uncharacterized protein n=1 Tax=Alsobacter soli TaxID=2109933 RepID=A0A2T1HXZ0_9HYPH|nr:hypothetical protein SLNSH_01715 [Alsobacter soli]